MAKVTMRQMLDAGVHFGHQTRLWNPKMTPYIFGQRFGVHIINLEKTLPLLQEALKFIASVASKRGKILFVGTKDAACDILREQADRCGMPYVNHRWLGGMLTNYKTIRQSIKRLRDLEKILEEQKFEGLTKKERLSVYREHEKLSRGLGGIKNMGGIPDVVFVIDVGEEKIAVDEARKLGIPVVGIVDTNNNPDDIDYMIPGNDDSFRSIAFYCECLADTIIEARQHIVETDKMTEEKNKKSSKDTKPNLKPTRKIVTKKKVDDVDGSDDADLESDAAVKADVKTAKAPRVVNLSEPKSKASTPADAAKETKTPAAKKAPTVKKVAAKTPDGEKKKSPSAKPKE